MVIWFGIGETSKILLIYLAIFAPVAMSALAGIAVIAVIAFILELGLRALQRRLTPRMEKYNE